MRSSYFGHDRLDSEPVLRRRLDDRDVPQPHQGHVERARDRSGGERQDVHRAADLLEALLVADAEALLLVDDHQPEIPELDVLGEQPVRADHDVDQAVPQAPRHFLLLLGCPESGEHLDLHALDGLEPAPEGLQVLERKHRRRHEDGDLLVVAQGLEGGPHRHFRLAETHVAAHEPVHDARRFHVLLDVPGRRHLVIGRRVSERPLELPLPVAVRRVAELAAELALGVELQQVVRHVQQPGPDPLLGPLPGLAAEAVRLRRGTARAVIGVHEIEPRQRYVQLGALGVLEEHEVLGPAGRLDAARAEIAPDSVLHVHDSVTFPQVLQIGQEGRRDGLARRGPARGRRLREDVLDAVDRHPRVRQEASAQDPRPDENRGRCRPGDGRLLLEVATQALHAVTENQLVRHSVLAEQASQPIDVARRYRGGDHPGAVGDPCLDLLHAVGDVALEVRCGLRRDVAGGLRRPEQLRLQAELVEGHLLAGPGQAGEAVEPKEEVARVATGPLRLCIEPLAKLRRLPLDGSRLMPGDDGIGDKIEQSARAPLGTDRIELPAGRQEALARPSRRELLHRQDAHSVEPLDRLLRDGIERADRLDLVAEEMNPHGMLGLRDEHVQDPAPHRELPDHLDRVPPPVAAGLEALLENLEQHLVAHLDLPAEILVQVR